MSDLPLNLVHIALAHEDHTMLTSLDGKRIEVNLAAVASVLSNPPAMFPVDPELTRLRSRVLELEGENERLGKLCDNAQDRAAQWRSRASTAEVEVEKMRAVMSAALAIDESGDQAVIKIVEILTAALAPVPSPKE